MAWLGRHAPRLSPRVPHLPIDWMKALTSGDADLKLGRHYGIPAAFRSEVFFEEHFTCVVRRDHPIRAARPTLKQFADLSYLDIVPTGSAGLDTCRVVDELPAQQGLQRRVAPQRVTLPGGLEARRDSVVVISHHDQLLSGSVCASGLLVPRMQRPPASSGGVGAWS